jgi:fatty acid desaturase
MAIAQTAPRGAPEALALTNERIEDRVEAEWYSPTIPRKTLKKLMQRNDRVGLQHFGLWLALLGASGYVAVLSWGTWWAIPAFLVYGTIYSSSDARWHECAHGTPFRTRWLNEVFYELCSFMTIREATLWRWSHARHHTHTIVTEHDPEIQVTRPADLLKIIADFFYIYSGPAELRKVLSHAAGHLSDEVKGYVPESARARMIWSSRVYVLIFGGVAVWAVAIGSFLPLMFVWTPRFYCGWHHQLCGLTQHAGLAENVTDHRLNTRTVYMNPVNRFLYFNMNYHLEHHMFPMVPFHALPKLHAAIKDQMPKPYASLWDAYKEIVPALIRQSRDAGYYVVRTLPAPARAA